jgi:hypothetical protein
VLILFDTRSSTRTLGVLTAMCAGCGGPMPHQLYRKLIRLSLFFVPTVPISFQHYTVCLGCSRTLKVTAAEAERLQAYAR